MSALFKIDDPQRKALETISAIAHAALTRNGGTQIMRGLHNSPSELSLIPAQSPTAMRAKAIYAARRRRDRAFMDHVDLLADPAWDIMLDLFVAHHENRTVSVSSACVAACVAQTTALRWLTTLEHRELIKRTPDYDDRRRQFVSLSATGLALVEHALA